MKTPPHEKAAVVDLFLDFIGKMERDRFPYGFWLARIGKCTYGDAIEIIKGLETLPIIFNKAGVIINKLKKFNAKCGRN